MKKIDITSRKVKDYTYLIIFFLIFSFFVFFAIRPSLITAYSLTKEQQELQKINQSYEKAIIDITDLQRQLQLSQDKLDLLSESLPERPGLDKLITDIQESGERNSIVVRRIDVENISLSKNSTKSVSNVEISLAISSEFGDLNNFIKDLSNQRRIKAVKKIEIIKGEQIATVGGTLNAELTLYGYYL